MGSATILGKTTKSLLIGERYGHRGYLEVVDVDEKRNCVVFRSNTDDHFLVWDMVSDGLVFDVNGFHCNSTLLDLPVLNIYKKTQELRHGIWFESDRQINIDYWGCVEKHNKYVLSNLSLRGDCIYITERGVHLLEEDLHRDGIRGTSYGFEDCRFCAGHQISLLGFISRFKNTYLEAPFIICREYDEKNYKRILKCCDCNILARTSRNDLSIDLHIKKPFYKEHEKELCFFGLSKGKTREYLHFHICGGNTGEYSSIVGFLEKFIETQKP